MLEYLDQVQAMSDEFVTLLAEALGLPPDGLSVFYDKPEAMQHRAKVCCVLMWLVGGLSFLIILGTTDC